MYEFKSLSTLWTYKITFIQLGKPARTIVFFLKRNSLKIPTYFNDKQQFLISMLEEMPKKFRISEQILLLITRTG